MTLTDAVYAELQRRGPLSESELAQALGMNDGQVRGALLNLRRKGLIEWANGKVAVLAQQGQISQDGSLERELWAEVKSLWSRVRELETALRERDKLISELNEKLLRYRAMFTCNVCGKPMSWEPDDALAKFLKELVLRYNVTHKSCVDSRKG